MERAGKDEIGERARGVLGRLWRVRSAVGRLRDRMV